ncbi:unnamed protein product [Meloidogyne enterolobii]|uniref:Uncharacterized protein n=1 Tax=Meloidogyne enterolobii TaxID=390850 RepID=A0ACB0YVW9_MELEN
MLQFRYSVAISSHSIFKSSGKSLSQGSFASHNFCNSHFPFRRAGEIRPQGSKHSAIVARTFLFVHCFSSVIFGIGSFKDRAS